MSSELTFAVPKGRILDEALPVMARAGVVPEAAFHDKSNRALSFASEDGRMRIIRVRAFDVATFVAHGAAQIGIVGSDVVEEFDYADLYAPVDLDYAQGKFAQAQKAMASRKYDDAALLADESSVDSELARAKARLGSARAQNQSKSKENSRMRVEMIDNHANDTVPIPSNVQESETVLPEATNNPPPPAGGETQPLNDQGGR